MPAETLAEVVVEKDGHNRRYWLNPRHVVSVQDSECGTKIYLTDRDNYLLSPHPASQVAAAINAAMAPEPPKENSDG